MALINGAGGTPLEVDTHGSAQAKLLDANGNPITKMDGDSVAATDALLPIAGRNDLAYRPVRVDRRGGLATASFMPYVTYQLFTAALPPTWLAPATTQTLVHNTASGTLLNGSGIGTLNTHSAIVSFSPIPRLQKNPLFARFRARLVKGGTNGQAEIGFTTTQSPAAAANPNGASFLYGADGSLRPMIIFNSTQVTGNDISGLISSTNYYVWDIILDDDTATFIVQDPTTGLILDEQTLSGGGLAGRITQFPYLFPFVRSFVGGTANGGAATQVFVGDISAGLLDVNAAKDWAAIVAGMGYGSVVNPTVALTQLENYANTAAPTSATLSNTASGYSTLGGQFQFAAVAGAETDYALFAFSVPTGVKLNVTGITIDTFNTGAAVATTATLLQWFAGADGAAVTLAANNFRKTLGVQSFAIGAAIGAQATTINRTFKSPLVTNGGRIFHVGLKIPLGTATASQIVRGIVSIDGYFD